MMEGVLNTEKGTIELENSEPQVHQFSDKNISPDVVEMRCYVHFNSAKDTLCNAFNLGSLVYFNSVKGTMEDLVTKKKRN